MKPRKPVKRVNPKRKASEFKRCYHSKARVERVKALRCLGCGRVPCEHAHVPTK